MKGINIMKWKIHAPNWNRENQKIKWRLIYGSNYYMSGGENVKRVPFDYPETADHFYCLYKTGYNLDIIFASYSVKEIRRFIKQMSWTKENKKRYLYIYDAPRNKHIKGEEFVKRFIR